MQKTLLLVLLTLSALHSFSQTKSVSGSVTDQRNGQPVAGVTVTAKGTDVSTTTQPDGTFRFSIPSAVNTLVFSSIGYETFEAEVGSGTLSVQLNISRSSLSEVVITGYTTANKRQVAGSVTKLAGEEIKLQPVGSFDKALQGKVAGLLSQSQSGQPGAPADVTIRGKGSINGTNTPLYIVDGLQVNAADFASINPGDIETFNVLKDASATAIYGSRGANGVIVITTKRGAAGQTKIDYDFQYGYSELPKNRLELMNSKEKLQYEFYDRPDYGTNPIGWLPDQVDSLSKVENHILESLFHKGITQQHQVSASGGNDKTRFYLSGSIYDQQGIVRTTGLKRYTGRANIDHSFGNFKIGVNTSLGYSRLIGTLENDSYIGQPLNAIRWFNPYLSLYDANGEYQNDDIQGQPNPLRELVANHGNSDQLKGIGSAFIEFTVPWVKGLKVKTLWGGDYTQNETLNYLDRTTDQGTQSVGGNGQLDRAYAKTFRYTGTTSINYQKNVGDHEINVSLFNELIQSKSESFGFSGFGLVGPFKNESGITPGTPNNGYIPVVSGTTTENGLVSFFVDGVYGYKGKYYLNAGARRDGSSRLSKDQRWANFGHVGISWIMSDESFMESTRGWLNSLKASYGAVGSQGIGDFASREILSPIVYNGISGLVLTNLPRPLTWERKVMLNTGVEFSLFKGINGTIEYYSNLTKDLFLDRQLSRTSGFESITNNLGELSNSGIEISISADIVRNSNFSWSVEANYTHNKSKLKDQAGQDQNINGLFINKVGEPINSFYLVRYAGVDPANGDALYYKADGKSTTNVYDPDDRVLLGTTDPPNFGGFGTSLNYKGIELNVLFSYAFGAYVYNNDMQNVVNPAYWYSNLAKIMLTEWQQPGDITTVPSSFSDFKPETTRLLEKSDYLRLRNILVSYTLPKSFTGKRIRNLRVFAQGQNLHVWHNFLGYDPEITTGILQGAQYPQLKTVTFGLNLGL
jgi:TonB-dependent starch-binding outer membrane protein SusC